MGKGTLSVAAPPLYPFMLLHIHGNERLSVLEEPSSSSTALPGRSVSVYLTALTVEHMVISSFAFIESENESCQCSTREITWLEKQLSRPESLGHFFTRDGL